MDADELLEYRKRVVAEVELRALKVREVELEIARVVLSVETMKDGLAIRGKVVMEQVRDAHIRAEKRKCSELRKELERAAADLARAERRLIEVDEEIEETGLMGE
jgi:hypothetical protein